MNSLETALTVLLALGGVIYFSTCLAAFAGLFRTLKKEPGNAPRVSVVIAARNEEENIGNLLEDLVAQDYPADRYEIIAVDDASDDRTAEIIHDYAKRDGRIREANTRLSQSPYSHKKRAVHEGVLSSAGEIILTVDADCRVPRGWIHGMMEYLVRSVDLVAGEVIVEGNSILARLESLEMTGIQAMAAGLMNIGFPITCNGANLAYRRSAFDRAGGFQGIGRMVSGDDDLLMQKIAKGRPSRVVFVSGPNTAVRVQAAKTFTELISKRIRWASKIPGYPDFPSVLLLGSFFLFFAAVCVSFCGIVAGLFAPGPLMFGYGLKMSGDLLLTGLGLLRNGKIGRISLFAPAEMIHAPYILAVTVWGYFGAFEWRGRRARAFHTGVERGGS